jgi:peptide/nickel transport system substrate-binding protein
MAGAVAFSHHVAYFTSGLLMSNLRHLLSKLSTFALLCAACSPFSAYAVTVRVANQGDVLSLDPHSFNEAIQLSFLNNVFESLATRGKDLKIGPSLATSWSAVSPTTWRFELRRNVRFHDGSPFTADDAVFSLERARGDGSDVKPQLASVKAVRKVSDFTIELDTTAPNPILPELMTNILIMSKSWCEANQATKPVDRRKGIENAASFKANGTGPYRVRERQPSTRTVLARNPQWWNKLESNVDEVIFMPIENNSTRVAALLSGEVDVIDPVPLPDMPRIAASANLQVVENPELRVVFLGFDQKRDQLLNSSVKGKNPFKDQRVRQAFYQAIDINTIKTRIMRNSAFPTGGMVADGIRGYTPDMKNRLAYDPEASKKLLTDAGYPGGFEVGMNCPNDRYVNDAEVCQAVATNLARVGIKIQLQVESKSTYFPKALKREVSFFMLGWTPAAYDAHNLLFTVLATPSGTQGSWNFGAYSNPKLDELTTKIQSEINPDLRSAMVKEALDIHSQDVGHIPLYQQTLVWAMKKNVTAYQRADGFMLFKWMNVK